MRGGGDVKPAAMGGFLSVSGKYLPVLLEVFVFLAGLFFGGIFFS